MSLKRESTNEFCSVCFTEKANAPAISTLVVQAKDMTIQMDVCDCCRQNPSEENLISLQ